MWGMPGKQKPHLEHTPLSLLGVRHAIPMRKLNDPGWEPGPFLKLSESTAESPRAPEPSGRDSGLNRKSAHIARHQRHGTILLGGEEI